MWQKGFHSQKSLIEVLFLQGFMVRSHFFVLRSRFMKNVLISPSKTKKWLVKKSCKTTIVDTFPVEGSQLIVKYCSKLSFFDVNFNSNEFSKFLQRFPPKPGCVYRFILLGLTFILIIKYIKSLIFVTCNRINDTKKWC